MKSGILLIDKPEGITSAAVVARLKRGLELEKIGHAGTLDPMATGLLVCLVGAATRLAHFAEAGMKVYSGTIQLGLVTDSDDVTGKPLRVSDVVPTQDEIFKAADLFCGDIEQIPPRVSALKIDGERSYKLARQNREIVHAPRRVTVKEIKLQQLGDRLIGFKIQCSKGTYIRAIARDLGEIWGCGACLASLRREESEPFSVNMAKCLDEVTSADILEWVHLFPRAQRLELESHEAERLSGGDQRVIGRLALDSYKGRGPVVYSNSGNGETLGILVQEGAHWKIGVNV